MVRDETTKFGKYIYKGNKKKNYNYIYIAFCTDVAYALNIKRLNIIEDTIVHIFQGSHRK